MHRCRVFLSVLLGHSEQRTRGERLSAMDVPGVPAAIQSDGSSQTVSIKLRRFRDRDGVDRRAWAQGLMSAIATSIIKVLLATSLVPALARFSLLTMKALMVAALRMPYHTQRGQLHVFLEQEVVAHIWSNVSTPPFVEL